MKNIVELQQHIVCPWSAPLFSTDNSHVRLGKITDFVFVTQWTENTLTYTTEAYNEQGKVFIEL